jgi:hypothetical protein
MRSAETAGSYTSSDFVKYRQSRTTNGH